MFKYWKMRWMILIASGLVGGSAIVLADEPADSHASSSNAGAHESGGCADYKSHHVWYGPMSLSYVDMDNLKLSPQQENLWKKALEQTNEAFDRVRIISRDMRDQARVDLDKPGADLKQIIQREEEARPRIEAAFKTAREAWFAAYDSLSAAQKEQLREAIRDGMDYVQSAFPAPPAPSSVQRH